MFVNLMPTPANRVSSGHDSFACLLPDWVRHQREIAGLETLAGHPPTAVAYNTCPSGLVHWIDVYHPALECGLKHSAFMVVPCLLCQTYR